jgi:hypothetical protein
MGGVTLVMELDYAKKTVRILNQEMSLKTTNVVLVDLVDGVNGPAIVDQRWINSSPQPGSTSDPIVGIIKPAPDLFEYLQCNVTPPSSTKDAIITTSCEQLQP